MEKKDQNIQPTSAARRQRQRILAQALKPSTLSFFKKINFLEGMQGLDLGCGTGETTLQLKALIGAEGRMTGIDSNSIHIQIAKEKAIQDKEDRIEYRYQNILEWKEDQQYDFVYSRLFFNQLREPLSILKQTYNSLKSGGFAMVEDLDFSKYYCFPHCYAFDRYVELYTTIKKRQGADAHIGSQLYPLFQRANFTDIKVQLVRPAFLKEESKHIASLTLESIAPLLLEENLTTQTELQALLSELKDFEEQADSLITMPGIYQVWGYRQDK